MRALQAAGGGKKRAWFGLKKMPVDLEEPDDMCDDGLAPSVALVHGLIDAQIASGVPAERVLVGGFSQGSTVHTHPLALRGLSACWASPSQGAVARAHLPALGGSITA